MSRFKFSKGDILNIDDCFEMYEGEFSFSILIFFSIYLYF